MLFGWKRKPAPVSEASRPDADAKRNRQQNIKCSEDCAVMFAAVAEAEGMSRAALFEDMVAERLESLQRRGVKVEITAG